MVLLQSRQWLLQRKEEANVVIGSWFELLSPKLFYWWKKEIFRPEMVICSLFLFLLTLLSAYLENGMLRYWWRSARRRLFCSSQRNLSAITTRRRQSSKEQTTSCRTARFWCRTSSSRDFIWAGKAWHTVNNSLRAAHNDHLSKCVSWISQLYTHPRGARSVRSCSSYLWQGAPKNPQRWSVFQTTAIQEARIGQRSPQPKTFGQATSRNHRLPHAQLLVCYGSSPLCSDMQSMEAFGFGLQGYVARYWFSPANTPYAQYSTLRQIATKSNHWIFTYVFTTLSTWYLHTWPARLHRGARDWFGWVSLLHPANLG